MRYTCISAWHICSGEFAAVFSVKAELTDFARLGFLPKWTCRDQQSLRWCPWICGVSCRSVQTVLGYLLSPHVYYLRIMVHAVQDLGPQGSQKRDGGECVIYYLASRCRPTVVDPDLLGHFLELSFPSHTRQIACINTQIKALPRVCS